MDKSEKEILFNTAQDYLSYFNDELSKLLENLNKCKSLEEIANTQIAAITALPAGRGTQHYLIEHMGNAISLQTQEQSLIKDITNLKTTAMNYALKELKKDNDGGTESENILSEMSAFLKRIDASGIQFPGNQQQDDAELDKLIAEKINAK